MSALPKRRTSVDPLAELRTYEHKLPSGRTLHTGDEVTVKGWRGRYVYRYTTAQGELVVFGGPPGRGLFRTPRPEHVVKKQTRTLRGNTEDET